MGQTVALYNFYGVSKAKTAKAVLVEIMDGTVAKQSWLPLSVASVKFIGKNYQVKVTVPGWFYSKISWKAPQPYTPKAPKNPYVGMDYGNMMEEQMILQERLAHEEYEYGMYQDSDDMPTLLNMANEINELKTRLAQIQEAAALAVA